MYKETEMLFSEQMNLLCTSMYEQAQINAGLNKLKRHRTKKEPCIKRDTVTFPSLMSYECPLRDVRS